MKRFIYNVIHTLCILMVTIQAHQLEETMTGNASADIMNNNIWDEKIAKLVFPDSSTPAPNPDTAMIDTEASSRPTMKTDTPTPTLALALTPAFAPVTVTVAAAAATVTDLSLSTQPQSAADSQLDIPVVATTVNRYQFTLYTAIEMTRDIVTFVQEDMMSSWFKFISWLSNMNLRQAISGTAGFIFITAFMSSYISPLAVVFSIIGPFFNGDREAFTKFVNIFAIVGRLLYYRSTSIILDGVVCWLFYETHLTALVPLSVIIYTTAYHKALLLLFTLTVVWYISERMMMILFSFPDTYSVFQPQPLKALSWASSYIAVFTKLLKYFDSKMVHYYTCSWFVFSCLNFAFAFSASGLKGYFYDETILDNGPQFALSRFLDNSESFLDSVLFMHQNSCQIFMLLFISGCAITALFFAYSTMLISRCIVDLTDRAVNYFVARILTPIHYMLFLSSFISLGVYVTAPSVEHLMLFSLSTFGLTASISIFFFRHMLSPIQTTLSDQEHSKEQLKRSRTSSESSIVEGSKHILVQDSDRSSHADLTDGDIFSYPRKKSILE